MIHVWDWQSGSTMTNASSERGGKGRLWLPAMITLLMPAIFAADVATGYEFRLSDLYCILAVLMARVAGARRAQVIVSVGLMLAVASVADAYGVSAAALVHGAISLGLLGAASMFVWRSDRPTVPPRTAVVEPAAIAVPSPLLNELRQPLSVLLSDSRASLRWLKRDQPDLPEALLCAQRIVTNARRAGEMISAMGQHALH